MWGSLRSAAIGPARHIGLAGSPLRLVRPVGRIARGRPPIAHAGVVCVGMDSTAGASSGPDSTCRCDYRTRTVCSRIVPEALKQLCERRMAMDRNKIDFRYI